MDRESSRHLPFAMICPRPMLTAPRARLLAQVQDAMGSLWSAYLAVLATLKMQFARTTVKCSASSSTFFPKC